jgi:hypothetical protein
LIIEQSLLTGCLAAAAATAAALIPALGYILPARFPVWRVHTKEVVYIYIYIFISIHCVVTRGTLALQSARRRIMSRGTLFRWNIPLNNNNNKQHNSNTIDNKIHENDEKTIPDYTRNIRTNDCTLRSSALSTMSCRPTTYVPVRRDRERDPQHAVSPPKIHRRSPIHSPLPCHRARSDRFKLCRHYARAILATSHRFR